MNLLSQYALDTVTTARLMRTYIIARCTGYIIYTLTKIGQVQLLKDVIVHMGEGAYVPDFS